MEGNAGLKNKICRYLDYGKDTKNRARNESFKRIMNGARIAVTQFLSWKYVA